jgi:KTSC domain-containing protein
MRNQRTFLYDFPVITPGRNETILYTRFRSTGDVYRYFDLPANKYERFLRAESRGRYFHAHIRNRFRYEKLAKLQAA